MSELFSRIFGKTSALTSIFAYLGADVFTILVSLVLMPVFTYYISPAGFGLVSLCTTISMVMALLAGLSLEAGTGRFFFDYEGQEKKDLFFSVSVFQIFNASVLVVLSFFVGDIIFGWLKCDLEFFPFGLMGVLIGVMAMLSNHLRTYLIMAKRAIFASILKSATYIAVTVVSIFLVICLGWGGQGRVWGIAAGVVFVGLFSGWFLLHINQGNFNWSILKKVLIFSLPLVFHHFGKILLDAGDRFVIVRYLSMDQLGLYDIAYRYSFMLFLITNSLRLSIFPHMYESANKDDRETVSNISGMFIIATFIAAGGVIVFGNIFVRLIQSNYRGILEYTDILIAGSVAYALYGIFMFSIGYSKKTQIVPVLTVLVGVLNIAANIILIKYFGFAILGACFVTLIGYVLLAIGVFLIGQKYYRINYDYINIVSGIILLLLCSLIQRTGLDFILIMACQAIMIIAWSVFIIRFRLTNYQLTKLREMRRKVLTRNLFNKTNDYNNGI